MKDNGKFYATKNEQSWKRSTFKKCGLICKDNVSSNQKYLLENTWRWTLEKLIMVWPVSQFNFASITFMYFRILLSMLLTSAFFDKETISTFVLYYLKKIKRVDGWANTVFLRYWRCTMPILHDFFLVTTIPCSSVTDQQRVAWSNLNNWKVERHLMHLLLFFIVCRLLSTTQCCRSVALRKEQTNE